MATPTVEQKQIDETYFNSYNDLEVHRLMIDDKPRTRAYCDAIIKNSALFKDKIVMDVGSGTGILSLFAATAGAKIVHAVEASPMAKLIPSIAEANNFKDVIKVHQSKVESLTLKDLRLMTNNNNITDNNDNDYKVDIIISEWMGFYLLHESMLPSVLFARDNFLKDSDQSMIFPRIAKLYAAPCNLQTHHDKYINFWDNLYGYSFKPLQKCAKEMRLKRPEIDCIDDKQLLTAKKLIIKLDLKTMKLKDINQIQKELFFVIDKVEDNHTLLDGIALWFDTIFTNKNEKKPLIIWNKKTDNDGDQKIEENVNNNNNQKVKAKETEFNRLVLSTSPSSEDTHWKQTLIFLPERLSVKTDDVLGFEIKMKPNEDNYRLYNIELNVLPKDHIQCQLLRAMMQQQ